MFSKAFTKKTIIFYLFLILLSQLAFKAPSVKAYGALGGVGQSPPVAHNYNSSNYNSSNYVRCAPNSHSSSSYRGGCVHPNYPNHSSSSSRNSLKIQVIQMLAPIIDLLVNLLFGNSNNHYYGSSQSGSWSGKFAGSYGPGFGQQGYNYHPTYNHVYPQNYSGGGYGSGQHGSGYGYPSAYYGNTGYTNAGYHPTTIHNGNNSTTIHNGNNSNGSGGNFWGTFAGSAAGTFLGNLLSDNLGNRSTTSNNYSRTNNTINNEYNYYLELLAQQQSNVNNTNVDVNVAANTFPSAGTTPSLFGDPYYSDTTPFTSNNSSFSTGIHPNSSVVIDPPITIPNTNSSVVIDPPTTI